MNCQRVLYVINSLGTGGAERSLSELIPRLAQAGLKPTICCLERRAEGVQESVLVRDFRVRFGPDGGRWTGVRFVRQVLREAQPNLIHTAIFEADLAGRLASLGTGIPVLTSLVNTSYAPERLGDPRVARAKLWLAKHLDGATARHLNAHFHAITHAVKYAAVRDLRIDPARVTVIERGRSAARLGIPSQDRRERGRAAFGVSSDCELIVAVGRHEFQKRHVDLIAAFDAVAATRPRSRLLIAGRRGNASSEIEKALGSAVHGDRIALLGHIDEIPELLAAADLFVFPSLYEGLGGAAIEAMALGLPIAATRIPAFEEILEEGGNALLVEPQDPAALAGAMGQLLDDPLRRKQFGKRGLELYREKFTEERSTARMIDLYRQLLA